jgi:hypothetical protein
LHAMAEPPPPGAQPRCSWSTPHASKLYCCWFLQARRPLQAAAAAALAGLCTTCDGRDAARVSGALPQLVHVVHEQQKDPGCSAAEHAAKALMNAAACDAAKVTSLVKL